jgi:hypothetical protein
MNDKRTITKSDILDIADYEKIRKDKRAEIAEIKKHRRLGVGPDATFYFECFDTMWYQIQEMLRIEKGGEEQLADELAAYEPLVPDGSELVATLMFEIGDADRRAKVLAGLGGVEETVTMEIDGDTVEARAEEDVDRTSAAGKASSVQFLHFPLNSDQAAKFKQTGARVVIAITHPNYGHMAVLPEASRAELASDLD